ncbi:ATP-binding protein [Maridesulfovibrio hydrothermalis]|uniref:histidine kinase n=1 Tax=Maridesulfovibrio hydrothermalis AM13 = DSM 14728 TaxID=1121451 RepID=L0RI89_9BACT|nr:ATP-binding protein [Maridesulfovibrio hydrothermalis]CCO25331.1 PAS/PAC sensor hybrid histidine kinase [Maridesulfovibrio hydrothermalis AM13 = DSM 14728]
MIMKMRMSKIFQKTLLLNFVLFGVISCSMSLISALTLHNHMVDEYISKGKAIASSIASSSVEILLNRDSSTIQSMIDQFKASDGAAYVYVQDADGDIISHTFVPRVPEVLAYGNIHPETIFIRELDIPDIGDVIDITKPILAGMAGYVHVGMDKGIINKYVWIAIAKLQVVMFFIFWGSVFLLYTMVKRISEPLNQLTEYAKKLADHDFTADVEITSKDEIGLLAGTMKNMAGELTTLIAGLERAVGNATSELQDTLTYMEVIMDNLADGLLVVDINGKISLTNPALGELFNLTDEDVKGKDIESFFSDEMIRLFNLVKGCEHEVYSSEIKLPGRRTVKAVATPIHKWESDESEPICLGAIILVRDITYEKEVDNLKTDFISTVSHELRTPMTSILGFAKIIRKKLDKSIFPICNAPDKKTQKAITQVQDNIGIIVSEGQRLTELINDVLDIAKMESGKVDWRKVPVDMSEVLTTSMQTTTPLWQPKQLELIVDVEENLPTLYGDRDRILQVMVNLISNAVKFTNSGSITCTARAHEGEILVSVSDTGSGISPEDQKKIFERFKQAGDTLTGKPKGTGLGLPICKQIVDHHGGRIWVDSKIGLGSSFHFTLEIGSPEEYQAAPVQISKVASGEARPGSADSPLIMVADDDPALNEFLSQVLEEEGYRIITVTNGQEAVETAQKRMPQLITMDLKMPVMDGEQAIRALRKDPSTRHIPVIVISALAEGEKVGGDAAMIKPIDEKRLVETVHGLLQEDLMMTDPCMVLGQEKNLPSENLLVICPGKINYCAPSDLWGKVESGFKGTIFITAELSANLDLDRLSQTPDVQIVILPDN